jgi:hypothetical protein
VLRSKELCQKQHYMTSPFLLDWSFMPFLVAYATCTHIKLVIECHFLRNESHTNTYTCTMNNLYVAFLDLHIPLHLMGSLIYRIRTSLMVPLELLAITK